MAKRSCFTQRRCAAFNEFLSHVRADGYFWPEPVLIPIRQTVSDWAPELVIERVRKSKREVYLSVYEGNARKSVGQWHIPGGFNRWFEESIQAVCTRLALNEIGCDVTFERVLDAYKWRPGEHDHGAPLSLYVKCKLRGRIVETAKRRWFALDELPKNNMDGPHYRFLRKYLRGTR